MREVIATRSSAGMKDNVLSLLSTLSPPDMKL